MSDGNEILSAETVGKFRLLRMEMTGSSTGKFSGKVSKSPWDEKVRKMRNQKHIKGIEKFLIWKQD